MSIIYQNLLFMLTLWMTCQKHDFAKAGANISKTRFFLQINHHITHHIRTWSVIYVFCSERFPQEFFQHLLVVSLERSEECVSNWHFYGKRQMQMWPSLYKHFKNVRSLDSGAIFNVIEPSIRITKLNPYKHGENVSHPW